jgi:hypothetical protein
VREFTADEIKSLNCEKMGADLGELYSALWQELAQCWHYWELYVELFGSRESRVALLNDAAPSFFSAIQDVFWERTLLHLARLTDPATSMGREDRKNLSVKGMLRLIDDDKLRANVSDLIDEADKKTEFARDWRNRLLAHRDLDVALNRSARPLTVGSRASVKEALHALDAVLNEVETHYLDSVVSCEDGFAFGDAGILLNVVDDGLRFRAMRDERIDRGERDEAFMPREV